MVPALEAIGISSTQNTWRCIQHVGSYYATGVAHSLSWQTLMRWGGKCGGGDEELGRVISGG